MVDSITAQLGDLKFDPQFTKQFNLQNEADYGTLVYIRRIGTGCTGCEIKFVLPFPTKELFVLFGKEEDPIHPFSIIPSGDTLRLDFRFKYPAPRPYVLRVFAKEFVDSMTE